MTLYRWNSVERRFTPTSIRNEMTVGERVPLKPLQAGKGQRIRAEVAAGELLIRLVKGAWRMRIANNMLTVHCDEAVIIPSGFSHSAVAIEDSIALQMIDEAAQPADDSRWAV